MLGVRTAYVISSLGLITAASCASVPGDGAPSALGAPAVHAGPAVAAEQSPTAAPVAETTSAPASIAELYAAVEEARGTQGTTPDAADEPAETLDAPELAAAPGSSRPLPGRFARRVLHEEINEAENLFFTEDGRLFVSGAEDIYEIKRAANGSFTKTDHFHEECVVEGIVRSQNYLYGACWTLGLDLSAKSFLIGGELSANPVFRILGDLDKDVVANGMTVDPEGRVYLTYTTGTGEIVRLTFSAPLKLQKKEVWTTGLPNVNGIKYLNGAMYVTLLNGALSGQLARVPMLPDGSAGKPEILYERWLTVLDDIAPFEDGFIITDFLKGTLIFWDQARGVYAETPSGTFYGPTSVARGVPPMFNARQLLVPEKGNFLIRDERRGDLLSIYQLPEGRP
jgi:hypothetical protein